MSRHLPGVEVWAFGSRMNGRSHDGSDLDLVLLGPGLRKIETDRLTEFREALKETTIPFLIEVRDWAIQPDLFHRESEREHVVIGEEGSIGTARHAPVASGGRIPISERVLAFRTERTPAQGLNDASRPVSSSGDPGRRHRLMAETARGDKPSGRNLTRPPTMRDQARAPCPVSRLFIAACPVSNRPRRNLRAPRSRNKACHRRVEPIFQPQGT